MKYSQACLLKKQVDQSIEKLTKAVVGLGVTDAARTRLEVVSGIENQSGFILIDDDRKTYGFKVQSLRLENNQNWTRTGLETSPVFQSSHTGFDQPTSPVQAEF